MGKEIISQNKVLNLLLVDIIEKCSILTAPSDWLVSSNTSVLIAFFSLKEDNYNSHLDVLCNVKNSSNQAGLNVQRHVAEMQQAKPILIICLPPFHYEQGAVMNGNTNEVKVRLYCELTLLCLRMDILRVFFSYFLWFHCETKQRQNRSLVQHLKMKSILSFLDVKYISRTAGLSVSDVPFTL